MEKGLYCSETEKCYMFSNRNSTANRNFRSKNHLDSRKYNNNDDYARRWMLVITPPKRESEEQLQFGVFCSYLDTTINNDVENEEMASRRLDKCPDESKRRYFQGNSVIVLSFCVVRLLNYDFFFSPSGEMSVMTFLYALNAMTFKKINK